MNLEKVDYAKTDIYLFNDPMANPKIMSCRVNCCNKEPETIKWIEDYIKDGDTIWDVGANVGSYSLIMAKLYPQSTILAIEPVFSSFYNLCLNREFNHCYNIVPIFGVLSADSGIKSFGLNSYLTGSADHKGILETESDYKILGLRGNTLANLTSPPQHLKIDVDGSEFLVIFGLSSLLLNVKSLIIETDETKLQYMIDSLNGYGLKPQSTLKHKFAGITNQIFAREVVHIDDILMLL